NVERLAVFTDGFIGSAQVVVRRPQVRSRIDVMRVQLQSFLVPRDGLLELLVVVKEIGDLEPRPRITRRPSGLVFEQLDCGRGIDRRMARRQRARSSTRA